MCWSYGCLGVFAVVLAGLHRSSLWSQDPGRQWHRDGISLGDWCQSPVRQHQGRGSTVADKRTKIEVMIVKQKMDDMKTKLRWISSETQISDGLTKTSARQLLADRLRTHLFSLQSDKTFQAAKRKTAAERQASERRNAIGRHLAKASLAYTILVSELTPVKAEQELAEQSFYMFDMFMALFVIMVGMFAWQCLSRMTSFLMSSMARLSTMTTSTQTKNDEQEETLREEIRDLKKAYELHYHQIQLLQQRVHDRDARLDELVDVRNVLERELGNQMRLRSQTEVFVSRTGDRYHMNHECQGLQNANPNGIRRLTVCRLCQHQGG